LAMDISVYSLIAVSNAVRGRTPESGSVCAVGGLASLPTRPPGTRGRDGASPGSDPDVTARDPFTGTSRARTSFSDPTPTCSMSVVAGKKDPAPTVSAICARSSSDSSRRDARLRISVSRCRQVGNRFSGLAGEGSSPWLLAGLYMLVSAPDGESEVDAAFGAPGRSWSDRSSGAFRLTRSSQCSGGSIRAPGQSGGGLARDTRGIGLAGRSASRTFPREARPSPSRASQRWIMLMPISLSFTGGVFTRGRSVRRQVSAAPPRPPG